MTKSPYAKSTRERSDGRTRAGIHSVGIATFGVFSLALVACEEPTSRVLSETREPMGTIVTITVSGAEPERARAAVEAAFAEIEAVEDTFSTYRSESELSRLDGEGSLEAGPMLLEVTRRALEIGRLSDGAFDPTVLPVLELFASAFEERGMPPSEEELRAALELVGASKVTIEGRRITLAPGAKLTLDGLAKGYAIDRAIQALREGGVPGALVDAGGDVRVFGSKEGRPWRVALQNPRDPADYLAVLELQEGAVATSGDYRRYFDPEREYHHIVDPRTGRSAHGVISATVRADTAMTADALATAVFVLGVERGLELVEGLDGVEALLVGEDRKVRRSSGW